MYRRWGKRLLDVTISCLGILLLLPAMIVISLAIKATSRGPVLFRQTRAGKDGVPFTILKFRSMVDGAEHMGAKHGMVKDDPRITRVGRILRATSLDELPELVNVVLGHMSLVGPRPTLVYQTDRYTSHQKKRLEVKPGITGLAQVGGRNSIPWSQRIELDIKYVENISLVGDIIILLRTVGVVLFGRGFRQDQLASEVEDFVVNDGLEE